MQQKSYSTKTIDSPENSEIELLSDTHTMSSTFFNSSEEATSELILDAKEKKCDEEKNKPLEAIVEKEILDAINKIDLKKIQKISKVHNIKKFDYCGQNAMTILMKESHSVFDKAIEKAEKRRSSEHKLSAQNEALYQKCLEEIFDTTSLMKSILSSQFIENIVNILDPFFSTHPQYIPVKAAITFVAQEIHNEYVDLIKNIKKFIDHLLEQGVSINEYSGYAHNPLSAAVAQGNIDIITYLISKGANVSAQPENYSGKSPLCQLIDLYSSGSQPHPFRDNIFKVFIEKGADLEAEDLNSRSFNSYLAEKLSCYKSRPDLFEVCKSLLDLQKKAEEITAKNYQKDGTVSLFWQSAKKIAELQRSYLIDNEQMENFADKDDIKKAIHSAKSFL